MGSGMSAIHPDKLAKLQALVERIKTTASQDVINAMMDALGAAGFGPDFHTGVHLLGLAAALFAQEGYDATDMGNAAAFMHRNTHRVGDEAAS